jgi:hypothetical protein
MTRIDAALLPDVHEIQQTLLKYPVALDSRCFGLLAEVFAPDARIAIPGMPVCGPAAFAAALEGGLARLDATHHFVNAPLLHLDGDHASARSYLVAQHIVNAAAPAGWLLIGAWYDDELQRTFSGWRITARTGNPVWWAGNGSLLGMDALPPAFERHVGHAAPPWLWSAPAP